MSITLDDSDTEKLNSNFFKKIDTKEKAYVLGYWVADGYISKYIDNRYVIGFSSNDIDLLENIRTCFCDFSGIHISKNGKNYQYRIYDYSLYNQLQKLGFDNKKSYTAIYPKIPKKFNFHFIRGVLDGDGCIYISKQKWLTLEFSGTEELLSEISKYLNGYGTLSKCQETYSCYKLRIYGKKAISVLNYIYEDSKNLRLERKYEKYKEALILYKDRMNIQKSIIHEHCKESIKK